MEAGFARFRNGQQDTLINIENAETGKGDDRLAGDEGANSLSGRGGDDVIIGRGWDDILYGDAGSDDLNGGVGADKMFGGEGDDSFPVDVKEEVIWEIGDDLDTVNASLTWCLADNLENPNLLGQENLDGLGNSGDNVINVNGGDNDLRGSAGDVRLVGGEGADVVAFGVGFGFDVVQDFESGMDRIDLSVFGFSSFAEDVVSKIATINGRAVLSFGDDDRLLLSGVDGAQLTDADFIL